MAINLTKGQKISLDKDTGSQGLTQIVMGLAWDPIMTKGFMGFGSRKMEVDLDASCIMFSAENKPLDVVFFNHLESGDGSVVHTGDNRTGEGDGDDEQIRVDLSKVHPEIKSLVFTVNSFTGQNFNVVENATCRLLDARGNKELARFNLSTLGPHTAQIMVKLYRHNGEWKLHALGETGRGATFDQLIPQIIPHL